MTFTMWSTPTAKTQPPDEQIVSHPSLLARSDRVGLVEWPSYIIDRRRPHLSLATRLYEQALLNGLGSRSQVPGTGCSRSCVLSCWFGG